MPSLCVASYLFNFTLWYKSYCLLVQSILEKIAPTWMNVSLRMKDDPETDKAFGWVLEMYVGCKHVLHGFSFNW